MAKVYPFNGVFFKWANNELRTGGWGLGDGGWWRIAIRPQSEISRPDKIFYCSCIRNISESLRILDDIYRHQFILYYIRTPPPSRALL